jgi:hypothetical protein
MPSGGQIDIALTEPSYRIKSWREACRVEAISQFSSVLNEITRRFDTASQCPLERSASGKLERSRELSEYRSRQRMFRNRSS